MKTKTNLFRNPFTFALLVLFGFGRAANAQYTTLVLPANLTGVALNNNGQALGYIGSSLYLITNGVQQFVSNLATDSYGSAAHSSFLNQKGQVAGVDSGGNLFLYFNGSKQIIEPGFLSGSYVTGLTDSGKLLWVDYTPTTKIYTARLYQNGVVESIRNSTTADGYVINNAGQILVAKPDYSTGIFSGYINFLYNHGVWTTPANLAGGKFINNKGQILTSTSQYLGASSGNNYSVNIGIYDIAADSVVIEYSTGYNQYIGEPRVARFNDAGDFAGAYFGNGYSSSNQSAGFGYIHGKYKSFGYIIPYPSMYNVNHGWVSALNNHGDTLWTDGTNGSNNHLYHADTDISEPITQYSFGQYDKGLFLNDNRQFIMGDNFSGKVYSLITPSALMPADSVSGVVMLEGEGVNAPAQNVTFEFRDAASNQTLFSRSASVSPYGGFTVSGVPAGSYSVRVKSPKNLAQVVGVTKANGALSGVSVFLPAGDANNDNSVDATDFGLFVGAYNSDSATPGSGYDATCDFNGDGFVDATDFGLFLGNYNTQGAL